MVYVWQHALLGMGKPCLVDSITQTFRSAPINRRYRTKKQQTKRAMALGHI
jgi:hypothetical protein